MGRRGPPPKPTALKILRGNPGRRPLNAKEPMPDVAIPTVPAIVTGEARVEWERIAPELETVGLITRVDRAALTAYCLAWADYVESRREGVKHAIRRDALLHLRATMTELGLTPASRSRIHVEAPKPKSALETFQAKHGRH